MTARHDPRRHARTEAHPARLRCFLVEDNDLIRENLIATLRELSAVDVVGVALDEESAIAWLKACGNSCDLIVIDILLKSGTGFAVLEQAKVLCPAANRIVLTNFAAPEIRHRCRSLGADVFFDKSAELEQFFDYCVDVANNREKRQSKDATAGD